MAYRQQSNGLTVAQERFARFLAMGLDQSDAYRKAHDNSFRIRALSPQQVAERACRWAARPQVRAIADNWLKEAKAGDLHTVGEWLQDLLDGQAKAKAEKNWTAYAALKRLSGTAVGALNETITVRAEQSMSDETLVKQLAKGDPAKTATLTALLGGKKAA